MKFIRLFVLFGLAVGLVWAKDDGPDPRMTGAPGDDPLGCATSGCHTAARNGGPVNAAGGRVTATFSTGNVYYPGVPVVVTVSVTDPINSTFGFQMTARRAGALSTGQAGRFTASDSGQLVICENNSVRGSGNCPAASPIEFIEHSKPSTGRWKFTWTPGANDGAVTFYVAGNAVNNNGQSDGDDHVYTANFTLQPAACAQVNPEITSVNSGTDFGGGFSNITPGTWVEVKGRNLGNSTRIWEDRDFLGTTAPSSVDGVRATVNGKPAAVYYVSPTQVNIQAPADTASGSVAVVLTACGGTSPGFNAQLAGRVPGLLAPAAFKVGGKQYLAALFGDGTTFVGSAGLIPGANFRPAKPGDLLTTYGIGFGDVTPPQAPGVIVGAQNRLVNEVAIRIGTANASIGYQGLAPGFVGLYQFNFTVPDVPVGDQPLVVTSGGTALAQPEMFLTIGR